MIFFFSVLLLELPFFFFANKDIYCTVVYTVCYCFDYRFGLYQGCWRKMLTFASCKYLLFPMQPFRLESCILQIRSAFEAVIICYLERWRTTVLPFVGITVKSLMFILLLPGKAKSPELALSLAVSFHI